MIDLKYYVSIVSFELHKLKACICLKRAKSQMLSLNNSNNLLTYYHFKNTKNICIEFKMIKK